MGESTKENLMTASPQGRPGHGLTVALFATCINDTMFPGTPRATVEVLERLGCTVVFPREQTCCGQIFTNTGYFDEAVPSVRTYVKAFGGYDYIVGPSGSCVGAVRDQHPILAQRSGDAGLQREVAQVAPRTLDVSEFIVDVLGVTDVGAYFPHRVTYHPTCHSLRVVKVGDRPYTLLSKVRGLELVELPDARQCCGFGGTFSLKNADVSVAMAADKARNVASTGAEYLVAGDNSCLMNIGGVLSRQNAAVKPIHLIEILAHTEGN
ncbi:(Fe-S)-binding protein [Tessaracoccus antarcticus]|uniref:(Fe-S)-binding protein n=2 Tax=Tessaracoccus antarcticus TaxID=2479848 RepID=A0A3M0G8I2_9ACTN|nr:(Fe-S)-binding protein [Tessaracoccus antarcticus]